MIVRSKVNKKACDSIKNFEKRKEVRLNKGIFSKVKTGDTIIFFDKDDPSSGYGVRVTGTKSYMSFAEMLEYEGMESVLPGRGFQSHREAIDSFYRLSPINYTQEKEEKFGIVVIHFVRE